MMMGVPLLLPSSRQMLILMSATTKIMAGSFDIACLTLPDEQQPVTAKEPGAKRHRSNELANRPANCHGRAHYGLVSQ
jgi:hypothetical protein